MRKVIIALSLMGLCAGILVAYLSALTEPPLPPAFAPPTNPYSQAIYAEGIVESAQSSGQNINIYPEVAGTVKHILVSEGQAVRKGQVLVEIDDSIQRATVRQLEAQTQAAFTTWNELKAQPRKETLDVSEAQVVAAQASLKTAEDALGKQKAAYELDPRTVSKDALDSAINAEAVARGNLEVAKKQRDLTKAGAWSYDIDSQERNYKALSNSWASANALLAKYTLRAPEDGAVMTINPAVGSFVSTQGSYDSYTQGMAPVLVLGSSHTKINVRCYIDEILVPRLPAGDRMKAEMTIRGSGVKVPLRFVRIQPFVSPKIELADQRQERVDVRVLPVIFSIPQPENLKVYPGELVDVYISQ